MDQLNAFIQQAKDTASSVVPNSVSSFGTDTIMPSMSDLKEPFSAAVIGGAFTYLETRKVGSIIVDGIEYGLADFIGSYAGEKIMPSNSIVQTATGAVIFTLIKTISGNHPGVIYTTGKAFIVLLAAQGMTDTITNFANNFGMGF